MKTSWKSFFGGAGCSSVLWALLVVIVLGDSVRHMFGASVDSLAGSSAYAPTARGPVTLDGKMRRDAEIEAKPAIDVLAGEAEQAPMAPSRSVAKALTSRSTNRVGENALPAAPTRSWFPETFLFDPLVVTDALGLASVDVRVPARLTTYRILALAHSRQGSQAGTVAAFRSTLPAYVDPVVPPFLIQGDAVKLPVELVNTTAHSISLPLKMDAAGGVLANSTKAVTVAANASVLELADLRATAPGQISLHAQFGDADSIARTIPVYPSGKKVTQLRGGTLAANRTFQLVGAPDLEPGSTNVRLLVFPGALGIVRSELSAVNGRTGVADDAYALLLSGQAKALLSALGGSADPEAIRALTIMSSQRVFRDARTPNVADAALLAEAALAHPESPVLQRLAERLVAQVAQSQRPDGTFEGGAGWTLQRLLVATAQCVRVVESDSRDEPAKERAENVSVLASGAFERNISRIDDGYTAAAVLASGAVPVSLQEKLRTIVRKNVKERPDGSRVLAVSPGVERPDGSTPSEMEATALAAVALQRDPQAPWRADLGSALLGSYLPSTGWGDGFTNVAALGAVVALFKTPLPSRVQIELSIDGKPAAHGELSGAKLHQTMVLDAQLANGPGPHTFEVQADPPVAGLGFSLTLQGYVPYKPEPMNGGLQLAISMPTHGKVGEPLDVQLTANAPANTPLEVRQALAAGAQVDAHSLDALVSSGELTAYHQEPGLLVLEVPGRSSGAPLVLHYRVIPTLAGTLHAQASTIAAIDRPNSTFHLPPALWAIK